MKSLIRRRREAGAVCSICRSPDYNVESPEFEGGKLGFRCEQCGNFWNYGKDGGIYSELAEPVRRKI